MDPLTHNKMVSTICSATKEVFSKMLRLPAEMQPYYIEQGHCEPFDGVISLVGLAGAWTGAGHIYCSAALACQLSGALLAVEYAAVNEDVLDAVAEITNMIIGNVKSTLEDEVGPMGLSIPTVIYGRNYQARSLGVKEWVVVPFHCGTEKLEVKFGYTPNGKDGH